MPQFSVAPIADVVPQRARKGPSKRAEVQREYRAALANALEQGEALVIELDPEDKPLTIRNRIKHAAEALGMLDLTIRRKGTRILAYRPTEEG